MEKGNAAMPELSSIVSATLADYYEKVRDKVHELVAPISTTQLWARPYPYGNSVGHLLLHITGNLNYYIGAQIAGTGYLRDRDREFNETDRIPKEQVLDHFDQAIAMVVDTIRKQSAQDWCAPYSATLEPEAHDRFSVLMRMAGHAYHHTGQMIYLTKELAKPVSGSGRTV
jgi:uncharacterized damage-inducible protein DinB